MKKIIAMLLLAAVVMGSVFAAAIPGEKNSATMTFRLDVTKSLPKAAVGFTTQAQVAIGDPAEAKTGFNIDTTMNGWVGELASVGEPVLTGDPTGKIFTFEGTDAPVLWYGIRSAHADIKLGGTQLTRVGQTGQEKIGWSAMIGGYKLDCEASDVEAVAAGPVVATIDATGTGLASFKSGFTKPIQVTTVSCSDLCAEGYTATITAAVIAH